MSKESSAATGKPEWALCEWRGSVSYTHLTLPTIA